MNKAATKAQPHPEPVEGSAAAAERSLIDEVISRTPQIPAPQFAVPKDWEGVEALAKRICAAGWCPKSHCDSHGKPNQASVELAILQGMDLGVAPLMAVQGIAIINGVPAIWGDLMLAVVTASGLLEVKREWIEGSGDDMRAVCEVKRTTRPEPIRREFSVAMAKRAGLAGKKGPWQGYPSRMLTMRARSWALRDEFTDVLKGMASMEELRDSGALARAIEATEEQARAGSVAASITADLKSAGAGTFVGVDMASGPDKAVETTVHPDGRLEHRDVPSADQKPPPHDPETGEIREPEAAPKAGDEMPDSTTIRDGDPRFGEPADLLTPAEADWMESAQAMIDRLAEATSPEDLEVIAASGHVKPELDRMATAAPQQHKAVTDFIAVKRAVLG